MLHKGIAHSLKDVDTKRGIVQAYWSAFGNKDDQGDIVEKGCWSRSIKDRGPHAPQPRIKFLFEHDEKQLLGKPSELVEDSFGLLATCQIVPTTLGADCLLLYEAGVLSEHSVGYETVQSAWDSKSSARRLIECVLWEGSVVTWGANSETPVVALKSLTQPDNLSALADQAARLDSLLHSGTLHSEALCETLERELKALHAALAPAHSVPDAPYTIQGVLDSMNDLKSRLDGSRDTQTKAATQADKDAQAARAKKYGIGIKDGGNVTKPTKYASLSEDDFADPVNYSYPVDTKAHADNAASRFGDPDNRAVYTKAEQAIIDKRIAAAQKKFGETDAGDGGKASDNMDKRMVKGSGGDLAVSADGTHAAYTGTHTHSHKAMGSQGGDEQHEHAHEHKGDASHDHPAAHDAAPPSETSARQQRPVRKTFAEHLQARQRKTFAEHYQEQQCSDLLRDWQDVVLAAFTSAVYDAFQIGDQPESDISDALDGLKDAVNDWVDEAIKYGLSGYLDAQGYDGGTEYRLQNGTSGGYDAWGYMSRTPLDATPATPLHMKVGRAISGANRDTLATALNGIADGVKTINEHHGAIKSLLEKTDPDAVRQDEDNTQGDDDTENGGTNPNGSKSRLTADPTRRTAAVYPTRAGTTHQPGETDLSAIVADLDALKGRLTAHAATSGGKA